MSVIECESSGCEDYATYIDEFGNFICDTCAGELVEDEGYLWEDFEKI